MHARAQDYFDFVAGGLRPGGELSANDKAILEWVDRNKAAQAARGRDK